MTKNVYEQRRKKLLGKLKEDSVLVLFSGEEIYSSEDAIYPFEVNHHFGYITGLNKPNFVYLASKRDGLVEEKIFIELNDPVMEKWLGKKMSAEEVKSTSGIQTIDYVGNFKSTLNRLINNNRFKRIYISLQNQVWDGPEDIQMRFAKEIKEHAPQLQIENLYPLISKMRYIKDDTEIENVKQAIQITKEGLENILSNIQDQVKECELEAYYDFVLKKNDVKTSFPTIAAAGKNGTILHYGQNNSMIGENELILFDLGVKYQGYCSDISRTFPASGKYTERQKQIYNIILTAQLETIKAIKPNKTLAEINNVTKKYLAKGLMEIGLIKEDIELSKYYYHGVSHMLGMDTHDVSEAGLKLKPGMLITVEPGLYIEEEGIGIRIEDDVLVTKDGCINLSASIIKTVDEIEAYIADAKK